MRMISDHLTCPHEEDVLAAIATGRWPDRVDAKLRAHAAVCAICQDSVTVARAFACRETLAAPVPDASLVWLRAQFRARAEATRLAERPITIAQAVAFAAVVGVLGAVFGAASPWLRDALQWVVGALAHVDPRGVPLPPALGILVADHAGLTIAAALAVMLMPIAVYWVIRERGDEM
jgi:hypothetical protein